MNASKNKGKSWEREVAKHLSLIYGVNFQRVPNSGAYIGGFNQKRANTLTPEQQLLASGDIILPRFLSHITLECKFYKDFSFEQLLVNCKLLDSWIDQASNTNKIPLVLFKINHKGGFVVFEKKYHNTPLYVSGNYLSYTNKKNSYIIVKMEGFFEANKENIVALNQGNYTIYTNAFSGRQLQPTSTHVLSS